MPSNVNLTAVANRTSRFNITVFESDGVTPQNLSGTQLDFYAQLYAEGISISLHKSTADGSILIINAALGQAQLVLQPADTTGLVYPANVPCELTITVTSSGDVDSLCLGTLRIVLGVA